jgi:hypothetical protein
MNPSAAPLTSNYERDTLGAAAKLGIVKRPFATNSREQEHNRN